MEKYQSAKVRRVYEEALRAVGAAFPQYLDELKGIAHGAKVPFFKVRSGIIQLRYITIRTTKYYTV